MNYRQIFLVAILSLPVSADDKSVSDICSYYSDPGKVLECYDKLESVIKEPQISKAQNESKTTHGELNTPQSAELRGSAWIIGEETISRIYGEKEISAWIYAQEKVHLGQGKMDEPRLVMMCRGRTFYIFIDWKTHVGWGQVPVVINIDKGPPLKSKWRGSTSGNQMFYPTKQAGMLHHMLSGSEELKVSAGSSSGHALNTSFKTLGMGEASHVLRQHCTFQGEPTIHELINFD